MGSMGSMGPMREPEGARESQREPEKVMGSQRGPQKEPTNKKPNPKNMGNTEVKGDTKVKDMIDRLYD